MVSTASSLPPALRRFALLSQRQIKRGSHSSVRELESAILEFIEVHNQQPKPFVWTKSADAILNGIGRFASRTLAAMAQTICKKSVTQETSALIAFAHQRAERTEGAADETMRFVSATAGGIMRGEIRS